MERGVIGVMGDPTNVGFGLSSPVSLLELRKNDLKGAPVPKAQTILATK